MNVARIVMASQNRTLRDAEGGVTGGIRTAAYDAPTACNSGVNAGAGFCTLAGYHLDFSPAEMCRRYGDSKTYVAKVQALADANVNDGVLLPEEAQRTVDEAKAPRLRLPGRLSPCTEEPSA